MVGRDASGMGAVGALTIGDGVDGCNASFAVADFQLKSKQNAENIFG
jgi:hypothetical protein